MTLSDCVYLVFTLPCKGSLNILIFSCYDLQLLLRIDQGEKSCYMQNFRVVLMNLGHNTVACTHENGNA